MMSEIFFEVLTLVKYTSMFPACCCVNLSRLSAFVLGSLCSACIEKVYKTFIFETK